MRLYFVGSMLLKWDAEVLLACGVRYMLVSYIYGARERNVEALLNLVSNSSLKSLMVDSGAFTAWTLGTKIDIGNYLNFLRLVTSTSNVEVIPINLDVIPGRFGRVPMKREVQTSAEEGWENYLKLKEEVPNVVHVFHQHEEFIWLEKLAASAPYIGISPANDVSIQDKDKWLGEVFHCLDSCGYFGDGNRIRTHSFGMTEIGLLKKYPFFSADSVSWKSGSRFGRQISFSRGRLDTHFSKHIRCGKKPPTIGWLSFEKGSTKYKDTELAKTYLEVEKFLTTLWSRRGFLWE